MGNKTMKTLYSSNQSCSQSELWKDWQSREKERTLCKRLERGTERSQNTGNGEGTEER
jgi:hypothetical protein